MCAQSTVWRRENLLNNIESICQFLSMMMAHCSQESGACTAVCTGSACGKFSALPWLPQSRIHPSRRVSAVTAPARLGRNILCFQKAYDLMLSPLRHCMRKKKNLLKEGGAQESGNGGEKESATEGSAKDTKCKLIWQEINNHIETQGQEWRK